MTRFDEDVRAGGGVGGGQRHRVGLESGIEADAGAGDWLCLDPRPTLPERFGEP